MTPPADPQPTATAPPAESPHHHHGPHGSFRGIAGMIAGLSMLGHSSRVRLVTGLARLDPSDRVLDVGCGPGAAVRTASKTAAAVTGVDPAPVMLRIARALTLGRANTTFLEGTAEALPLPDRSVTVAWAIASAHHWTDVPAGLAELRRVLAPGGRLLIAERRTQPGARGLAKHGLSAAQSDDMVQAAVAAGFSDVRGETHPAGGHQFSVVQAIRPAD